MHLYTTMTTLEAVILLNNQVVSLLDCGEYHEARELSLNAMVHFQQMKMSIPERPNTLLIDDCMLARGGSWDDGAVDDFTYQHGIVLPFTMKDPTTVTTVLIFNSALTHHLLASAIFDPALQASLLQKALKLYKLAFGELDSDSSLVFKFAVTNNIGVIHRMLGNEELARDCFDYLVSTMMEAVHLGLCDQQTNKYLCGFWINVTSKDGVGAPAA